MSDFEELEKAKIAARDKLNSLPPEQAQALVHEVIFADMWEPDTSNAINWDDSLPIPKFLMSDEEDSQTD